jgi:hypothetical protein
VAASALVSEDCECFAPASSLLILARLHRPCGNTAVYRDHFHAGVNVRASAPSLQDSVKVLAKSLVRNRQYVTKMHRMKANLQAVSLKITVCPPGLCQTVHGAARAP